MWAILGGSGFERFDDFKIIDKIEVSTPFGKPSGPIIKANIANCPVLFLSRHGQNHEFCPSTINYRANIFALKSLGASKVLALSAVGSLQQELNRGDCVIPTQYINWTKLPRGHTFCLEGIVGHVSLAMPVDLSLVELVKKIAPFEGITMHYNKTYICIEGPAFSTKVESKMFRQLGADIVGMTNFPEYALAREAGLCYLPLSFVTDYDAWNDEVEHVTLDQIIAIMRQNNHKAFSLLQKLIPQGVHLHPKGCSEQSLKNGLMTPLETLPPAVQEWMGVLLC